MKEREYIGHYINKTSLLGASIGYEHQHKRISISPDQVCEVRRDNKQFFTVWPVGHSDGLYVDVDTFYSFVDKGLFIRTDQLNTLYGVINE